MSQSQPLVSIIIPTYNREKTIGECLDKVFEQTYTNFEVVIVDDGSIDQTKSVLEAYGRDLRYFYQENQGPSAARNRGIKEAKGEYVALLDSDDYWHSDKLEQQVKFLQENSSVDIVFSDFDAYDQTSEHSESYMTRMNVRDHLTKNSTNIKDIFKVLVECNVVIPSSVLMKRACFEKEMFDPSFRYCEDYDLWLRLTQWFVFGYQDLNTGIKGDQGDNLVDDKIQILSGDTKVFNKIQSILNNNIPESHRQLIKNKFYQINYSLGKEYIAAKDFRTARQYLHSAFIGLWQKPSYWFRLSQSYLKISV